MVSDAAAFQAYVGTDNELVIADYRFLVDPATWAQRGTVLIIKNSRKPLSELIADPNTWVLGTQFNRDVTATAAAAAGDRQRRRGRRGTDPEFGPFVALLADPTWNGVLAAQRARCRWTGSPRSSRASPRASTRGASRPTTSASTRRRCPPTSFPATAPSSGSSATTTTARWPTTGFDFTVRSLKVRFANSVVATFRSRIALALNELFATKVVQQDAADNVVELDGVFQKHGDSGTYVFSVTGPTTFAAQDNVLATVGHHQGHLRDRHHAGGRGAGRHRRHRLLLLGHARVPGAGDRTGHRSRARSTCSPTTASPTAASPCG